MSKPIHTSISHSCTEKEATDGDSGIFKNRRNNICIKEKGQWCKKTEIPKRTKLPASWRSVCHSFSQDYFKISKLMALVFYEPSNVDDLHLNKEKDVLKIQVNELGHSIFPTCNAIDLKS